MDNISNIIHEESERGQLLTQIEELEAELKEARGLLQEFGDEMSSLMRVRGIEMWDLCAKVIIFLSE